MRNKLRLISIGMRAGAGFGAAVGCLGAFKRAEGLWDEGRDASRGGHEVGRSLLDDAWRVFRRSVSLQYRRRGAVFRQQRVYSVNELFA